MKNKLKNAIYIVATPIGNLDDISKRAIEVLQAVDQIAVEDARHSKQLLTHLGINQKLIALHEHNEREQAAELITAVQQGAAIALISDAGTPAISDPGFFLVREVLKQGLEVECLPGATAFVPALVNSGLPTDTFVFEGFLPVKKGRQTRLKKLAEEERTIVLYESPHRLLKTLEEFETYFGADRQASVSRELTKMYEETIRGTVSEIKSYFTNNILKGEFVICIAGKEEVKKSRSSEEGYK